MRIRTKVTAGKGAFGFPQRGIGEGFCQGLGWLALAKMRDTFVGNERSNTHNCAPSDRLKTWSPDRLHSLE